MEVIEKNGLGQNGWIPTNKTKLNMEGRTNVFVIGDTTNIPISKAGSTAHFESETLGENIAAMVKMGMTAPVQPSSCCAATEPECTHPKGPSAC